MRNVAAVACCVIRYSSMPTRSHEDEYLASTVATGVASSPHSTRCESSSWQELSDVCIYLVRLSDVCETNLSAVLLNKYDSVGRSR